ncbi:hypothetical protein BKA69DRAFT_547062 [Paraphysoderma sedebokerense]|nr:hypothetical protein BKA69DRAFT_547062 [Paraphysoderma sedebokerense]
MNSVALAIAICCVLLSTALLLLQGYKLTRNNTTNNSSSFFRKVKGTTLNRLLTIALGFLLLSDIFQTIRALSTTSDSYSRSTQIFIASHMVLLVCQIVAIGIYAFLGTDRLKLFSHFIPKRLCRLPDYTKTITTAATFISVITTLGTHIYNILTRDETDPVYYFFNSVWPYIFYMWIIMVATCCSGCLTYFVVCAKAKLMTSITPVIKRQFTLVQFLVVLNLVIMLSAFSAAILLDDLPALYGVPNVLIRICFAVESTLLDRVQKVSKLANRTESQGDRGFSAQLSGNTGISGSFNELRIN